MYEEEKHLHVLSFYKEVLFWTIIFETPCIIWTLDTSIQVTLVFAPLEQTLEAFYNKP